MDKEQKINKIEQGTVIDHVPADMIFKVVDILKLERHDGLTSIATNLSSKKLGKKALIKIEQRFLTDEEVNKIAVLAPDATVSTITRYEVKSKHQVQLQDTVNSVIKCGNPSCITNHEEVGSRFIILSKKPLEAKCFYCERIMRREDIEIA